MGGMLYWKINKLYNEINHIVEHKCWRVTATRTVNDGKWTSYVQLPTFEIPECHGINDPELALKMAKVICGEGCHYSIVSV